MRRLKHCCTLAISAFLLTACGPNEEQRAQWAEEKRIECLDKFCPDNVEPAHDLVKEAAVKLNGQWFIGPREYFPYGGSTRFYWWDHKPLRPSTPRPSEVQALAKDGKSYDFLIEVFLRHHDGVMHGPNRYPRLQQAEAEGRLISKSTPRPGLEVWRIRETDGRSRSPAVWYVATAYVDNDPNGAVLNCEEGAPSLTVVRPHLPGSPASQLTCAFEPSTSQIGLKFIEKPLAFFNFSKKA